MRLLTLVPLIEGALVELWVDQWHELLGLELLHLVVSGRVGIVVSLFVTVYKRVEIRLDQQVLTLNNLTVGIRTAQWVSAGQLRS